MRPDGEITRGTTNPSRLRRVDRWITQAQQGALRARERPLIVDLGFGASPVTTLELYRRVRAVVPDAEVTGLEIDPERVLSACRRLAALRASGDRLPGLSFAVGGFELPVPRQPVLVRAFNVLRQYPEDRAWTAWSRLRAGRPPAVSSWRAPVTRSVGAPSGSPFRPIRSGPPRPRPRGRAARRSDHVLGPARDP